MLGDDIYRYDNRLGGQRGAAARDERPPSLVSDSRLRREVAPHALVRRDVEKLRRDVDVVDPEASVESDVALASRDAAECIDGAGVGRFVTLDLEARLDERKRIEDGANDETTRQREREVL